MSIWICSWDFREWAVPCDTSPLSNIIETTSTIFCSYFGCIIFTLVQTCNAPSLAIVRGGASIWCLFGGSSRPAWTGPPFGAPTTCSVRMLPPQHWLLPPHAPVSTGHSSLCAPSPSLPKTASQSHCSHIAKALVSGIWYCQAVTTAQRCSTEDDLEVSVCFETVTGYECGVWRYLHEVQYIELLKQKWIQNI